MQNPFICLAYNIRVCAVALAALTVGRSAYGCACGCDIFEVATSSMFPNQPGGMVFVDYDFQDQNQNWSGTSTAPRSDNSDREIKTSFTDVGLQYLFNSSWGIQVEVPYDFRLFTTKKASGKVVTVQWNQFGDVRLEG